MSDDINSLPGSITIKASQSNLKIKTILTLVSHEYTLLSNMTREQAPLVFDEYFTEACTIMRAVLQNLVGVPQTFFYRWGTGMEVIFDRLTACTLRHGTRD